MKQLYVFLVGLLAFSSTKAQLRLSLIGGPASASVVETNSIPNWETTTKPNYKSKTGIQLGFLAEVPLDKKNRFFFMPGALYTQKGRKYAQTNDAATAQSTDTLTFNTTLNTNYIEIPLNLGVKLPLGKKVKFFASVGPYLSFFYNGTYVTEKRAFSNNKFTKNTNNLEVGKEENKVTTFDFGLGGRAGFDFGGVYLSAFASRGVSDFYRAAYDGSFKHQVVGGSLGIWLNRTTPKPPKDSDKDGVPDDKDGCPSVPFTIAANGCPDRDNDGIPDATDKCPTKPGKAAYNGCPPPDTDKDGVNDEEDKCPSVPGLKKYNGCPIPDKDQDGINDEEDACPEVAGIAALKGCPQKDTDGDGITDDKDKCPTVAGIAANNGCPEIKKEVVEKVNYAAQNIYFRNKSDVLAITSYKSLDDIAKLLKENAYVQVTINGHTDNIGSPAFNKELSLKRAEAVKQYFLMKGIDASRIKAIGWGLEKPIASNSTPEGRSKNRRVEITLE